MIQESLRSVLRGLTLCESKLSPSMAAIKRMMTLDQFDFSQNTPEGFVWNPSASYAMQRPNRTSINVGPSFFSIAKHGNRRMGIIAHEFGHDLVDGGNFNRDWLEVLKPYRLRPEDPTRYDAGVGASYRPEEVISDLYAALSVNNAANWFDSDSWKRLVAKCIEVAKREGLPMSWNL